MSQFYNINIYPDKKEIKIFNKKCKIFLDNEPKKGDFIIDSKRQIYKKEKLNIWNSSNIYECFDYNIFKMDILGLVCIKKDLLNKYKTDNNDMFDYEYEHILSHCNGGKSIEDNICLLNKNINRHKKDKELYKFNMYELSGICNRFGISFIDLKYKLESNLHETCELYNLYFVKRKQGFWSINDIPYTNQYNNKHYYKNKVHYINDKIKILSIDDNILEKSKDYVTDNKEIIIGTVIFGIVSIITTQRINYLSNILLEKTKEQSNLQNELYEKMVDYTNFVNDNSHNRSNIEQYIILLDLYEYKLNKINEEIKDIKLKLKFYNI